MTPKRRSAPIRTSRLASVLAIFLGMLLALAVAAAENPAPSAWIPSATGDGELAAQTLEEAGAAIAPSRVGLGTYLRDLNTRVQKGFGDWFKNLLANSQGLGRAILFGAKALVWAAAAVVVIWLVTVLLGLWRRRGHPIKATLGDNFDDLPAATPEVQIDAGAWRRSLTELLAADRLEEALEALWWWLARSLAGPDADPSWTSRELVERSRRRDLLVLVGQLDTFQYGPRRPSSAQVERLAHELERALP